MSDEMLQKTIDLVSSLEAKNETQQIAKYELIEYVERLHKENQKLKKALKEGVIATCETCEEFGICPHSYREYDYKNEVENLKNQQKEFVEWLEKEISSLEEESQMDCINSMLLYDVERDERFYKRVLSKFKEIVGVDEE